MNTFLIVTSIAGQDNQTLTKLAEDSFKKNIPFILMGDQKSPNDIKLKNCDYYSIERQESLNFSLAKNLPINHYARKNLGYLIAISLGADIIIETDDDNIPYDTFWENRKRFIEGHHISEKGWVNVYKYFTESHIWPRGFSLENILDTPPPLTEKKITDCPIQQGLSDEDPDVDAIFRLTIQLPVKFNQSDNIALGNHTVCPFNSQNTTWFKEAFPLLYLPSYCSFRMTDIWRSFIAQRIAWTCGWSVLFHKSTTWQQRNDHNLLIDFRNEIPGYFNNGIIMKNLADLKLNEGIRNIPDNLILCYEKLLSLQLVEKEEIYLLKSWLNDINQCT